MCINPFSTNNILIHINISSSSLYRGPSTKFLSTSLKESLYSITNSIMCPSFIRGKLEINCSSPLIIQHLQPLDSILVPNQWFLGSQSSVSGRFPLQPFIQQTWKLIKEKLMQINVDVPLLPMFNVGY
jgi:hypothetical protein